MIMRPLQISQLCLALYSASFSVAKASNILVVGSVNVDTFLPVRRFPSEGENLTTQGLPISDIPGGKGATQAIAAHKMLVQGKVVFIAQLGWDTPVSVTEALETLDCSHCTTHDDLPCGRGYVTITSAGQVSAIVSGGSNQFGWENWETAWESFQQDESDKHPILEQLRNILGQESIRCVLLQQEIPEFINLLVANFCKKYFSEVMIVLDAGGEDRCTSKQLLSCLDYFIPNESELRRLVAYYNPQASTTLPISELVSSLQKECGVRNVLVTMGSRGASLFDSDGNIIQHEPSLPVANVEDETGAGDCFRAAFCAALLDQHPDPLRFACAAGACSVQTKGAVPSTPTREQVDDILRKHAAEESVLRVPRGNGQNKNDSKFPFLIGSRLNSMKDRPELWEDSPLDSPIDFVRRQSTIKGLTCVDFNYPQHFDQGIEANKAALEKAGLVAGAVCLRYPTKFARGSFNNPDENLRREAVQLTKQAAGAALVLGCDEVVIWSAFDGYDYSFQVDYEKKWDEILTAFREVCDAYPNIKFSLEYKPTDENTRFFTVPSTGAAMLLVHQVNRENFGLTLDVGHLLMSGENPAQSIAFVGSKLFGIQLNDGYTRLAAEDGLMFGSVHPAFALEVMYQLDKIGFKGHFYFDTFPQRSDPVLEAEYNIERVKAFWYAATQLDEVRLKQIMETHDAIGALKLVQEALRNI